MPSFVIVTPALAALVIFGRRYYIKDPVKRISDPNFVGCFLCLVSAFTYIVADGFALRGLAITVFCFALSWALLIAAVVATFRRPPAREEGPSPYFQK